MQSSLNVPVVDLICQLIFENQSLYNKFKNYYVSADSRKRLTWKIYFIDSGKEISYKINHHSHIARFFFPGNNLSFRDLMFLTETFLSIILVKNDIFLFHASSLVIDNCAYLFCGPSGVGKSTIIKLAKNYTALSDDTTVIKKIGEKFFVYPSPFDKDKNISFLPGKTQLGKIFFLRKDSRTHTLAIRSFKRLQKLIRNNILSNSYYFYNNFNERLRFYKLCIQIVKSIPVKNLFFTKSSEFLDAIIS